MKKKWIFDFTGNAKRQLKSLDPQQRDRIARKIKFFESQTNPLHYAVQLTGWSYVTHRFRAGDYRILAHVNHEEVIIMIVEIDHRRQAYRG